MSDLQAQLKEALARGDRSNQRCIELLEERLALVEELVQCRDELAKCRKALGEALDFIVSRGLGPALAKKYPHE